jgi:hypothetical protein
VGPRPHSPGSRCLRWAGIVLTEPDQVQGWSAVEVVTRWASAHPRTGVTNAVTLSLRCLQPPESGIRLPSTRWNRSARLMATTAVRTRRSIPDQNLS